MESVSVQGDPMRLTQVFSNLLDNASKYTPEGGRLSIAVEIKGSEVIITVSDNGIGIPRDNRAGNCDRYENRIAIGVKLPGINQFFVSDQQGRDHEMTSELALDGEGNFLALRITGYGNVGAYVGTTAPMMATNNAVKNSVSVYRTPLLHVATRLVLTNTTPVSAYRGAGRPEATYALERAMDSLAREVGVDTVVDHLVVGAVVGGEGNALLGSGEQKYHDAWRAMAAAVNAQARRHDGRTEYPTMHGADGWYGWHLQPWRSWRDWR